MKNCVLLVAMVIALSSLSVAAENLRLNQRLDYSSDSHDGPLITGDKMTDGAVAGKPNYLIIYGEGCFNSKRQARRTVSLYEKYKGRVNFVVIDLDQKHSREQDELQSKYYRGYIPHVVVLDAKGNPAYNQSGEVDESVISGLLDKLLR
jgi:predicted transcriptional regulator